MSLWDIAGYTFRADEYCPDHIVEQLDGQAPVPANEAEDKLDYLGVMLGINREDERSYDSGDFPKVIFADQVHDVCTAGNDYQPGQCGDCCGSCGKQLGGECPDKKEAVKLTADDSGCWVDGHWGQYAVAHLVQRAEELGYADAEVISLADRHMDDLGSRTTSLSDDEYWALNEASSEVENWLNDNVVPEGYSFGWHEGEFFLWPESQWEE